MSSEHKPKKSNVEGYVETYLSLTVQAAEEASTDTQLATVVLSIAEKIGGSSGGTIVDIGCGEGTLLQRLSELNKFRDNNDWLYVGVDEEDKIEKVLGLSRRERLTRRTDFFTIDEFYEKWPNISDTQIIVCRNVFHEIRIKDTARLLHHIALGAGQFDSLIIQDLIRFPVSERHNACWIPEELENCLSELGFTPRSLVSQGTRNGNAFFNLVSGPPQTFNRSLDNVEHVVAAARLRQWQAWLEIEGQDNLSLPVRNELVEALDIDLQITALTRQLRDVGILASLSPEVERRVRTAEFTRVVENGVESGLVSGFEVEERFHFRERGAQLNVLEEFLRGENRLALVHGGSGYGKTTLTQRLLATRSYGKLIVQIDGRRTKSAWAFLESMFAQVGIRLAPEQLSVLSNLTIASVAPVLGNFLNRTAYNLIIFIDDFDELLTFSGEFQDPELLEILRAVLGKDRIKVLLTSRKEYIPAKIVDINNLIPTIVRVGRYATDETVKNILDDYFDRSSSGIQEYPRSLLDAIDRHPLITSLAARALQKEGEELLFDTEFVSELANKLREELWGRIVGPQSREAVVAAASLRVAVPLPMLEAIAAKNSVHSAREEEVIYSTPDARWASLWSTLGLFKVKASLQKAADNGFAESDKRAPIDHAQVAALYRSIYRNDDDPKWIRESYFHQLLSSDRGVADLSESVGAYYYDELVSSADYHFIRSRNFEAALELYTQALEIRALNQTSEMRRASCLIRLGQTQEGEKAYGNLVEQFPSHLGIKTSHVDAIIYRHEYEAAEKALKAYGLTHESDWVEWQWGRTHLGLDEYESAIRYLGKIAGATDSDPHYFVHLARALDYAGDLAGAVQTLIAAKRRYPLDVGINSALGAALQRQGKEDEAVDILKPIFAQYPDNVQAAASLMRIELNNGSISKAKALLRQTESAAPGPLRNMLSWAQCQLDIAESKPGLALVRLEQIKEPDPLVCIGLLEALLSVVQDGDTSGSAFRKARNFLVPDRYKANARVQAAEGELALALRDRRRWDAAIANLERTRFPAERLAEMKKRWP